MKERYFVAYSMILGTKRGEGNSICDLSYKLNTPENIRHLTNELAKGNSPEEPFTIVITNFIHLGQVFMGELLP